MNIYSNKFINIISLIITIIIFITINLITKNNLNKIAEINQEKITSENSEQNVDSDIEKTNWYIEIPSISLKAPIKETTNEDVLNIAVGHFEETSKTLGNVGLAGHNRGYDYNYFENLKSVKIGDKIIYNYENFNKTYIIDKIETIKETDWSYLEDTKENKITLITCVENEPTLRRCVQATEKVKK